MTSSSLLLRVFASGAMAALLPAQQLAIPQFTAPLRMQAADQLIKIEPPGYAAPCWADLDGDGHKDLLVGQFAQGRIKVYRNLGEGRLAEGRWLEAAGNVAEIPGVW